MDYIKCSKCGSDEFIRVMAIPRQGTSPRIEERKLVCFKCKDELTADEINESLSK